MENKKLIPIIIVLVLVAGGVGYFVVNQQTVSPPTPVACTLEAKLCPDGSSVGRTGPNCEFTECPPSPTPTLSVVLENISPSSGPIGTEVIIRGSGFASTNNDIRFMHPKRTLNGYLNRISSSDGKTLRFNLPDILGACPLSQLKENEVCPDIGLSLPTGDIKIYVVNMNGVSNNVTFTVY